MTKKMEIEILGFIKEDYESRNKPIYAQALEMAMSEMKRKTMYANEDMKVGASVLMGGTVIEVSESGIVTILPHMDPEGYVKALGVSWMEEE